MLHYYTCLGGGDGDIVPGKKEKRRFSHLLSHKHDFLRSKQKAENIRVNIFLSIIYNNNECQCIFTFQLLYDETEEYLREKMPTFDTFIEVLGRLYINGFEICDAHMETYGWGVYLGPRYNFPLHFSEMILSLRVLQMCCLCIPLA